MSSKDTESGMIMPDENTVYMKTYLGNRLNPIKPDAKDIKIEDVAHALSLLCRGNGQVTHFYSVGQHCINAAKEAETRNESDRVILASLLHDASEAYMSDVIRPIKQFLPKYIEIENNFLDKVYERFGLGKLTEEERIKVKSIDDALLDYDMVELLKEPMPADGYKFLRKPDIEFRPFEEVEKEYIQIFKKYYNE